MSHRSADLPSQIYVQQAHMRPTLAQHFQGLRYGRDRPDYAVPSVLQKLAEFHSNQKFVFDDKYGRLNEGWIVTHRYCAIASMICAWRPVGV